MKTHITIARNAITLALITIVFTGCAQPESSTPAQDPSAANVQLVQGLYDSFATGNIPAVLEMMAPDIVWNEAESYPYADGNPYIGPDAILNGVFARIGADWETFMLTSQTLYAVGDNMVLATGRYEGVHRATGNSMNAQHAHIFWIEDGKVKRFQQYADTKHTWEAMQQAGGS
jgi:uncharacterized protein